MQYDGRLAAQVCGSDFQLLSYQLPGQSYVTMNFNMPKTTARAVIKPNR